MFFKKNIFFLQTKSWKNHPQKLLRRTKIHFFFSLLPTQPKWPNEKNSCSKMCPYRPTVYRTGKGTLKCNFIIEFSLNLYALCTLEELQYKNSSQKHPAVKLVWPFFLVDFISFSQRTGINLNSCYQD